MHRQAGQVIRPRARGGHKHVALFGGEWTKVGVAQSQIEGQVPAEFEVILGKDAPDVGAIVLSNGRRDPGSRTEGSRFLARRIVEKVPHVEEFVVWHAGRGIVLQVKEARNIATELNGVASDNFGSHVFVGVGPLIQDAANARSEGANVLIAREAADCTNGVRGKSNRRLRVGVDFVPAPSGSIHASFVEEARRDGAVPDCGEGAIDLRVMEEVVLADRAVNGSG